MSSISTRLQRASDAPRVFSRIVDKYMVYDRYGPHVMNWEWHPGDLPPGYRRPKFIELCYRQREFDLLKPRRLTPPLTEWWQRFAILRRLYRFVRGRPAYLATVNDA